ncbi:MAG: SDR family oxidoreductase [Chloroflexi bacterium]|nr:SDR family oxidoreductase [Chloroflexota bacterium]
MPNLLKDKVAIVTGGAGGLGRAVCIALAEQGAKVVVNDIGAALDGAGAAHGPADKVVEEIKAKGGHAVASYDSVTTMQGGEAIVKTAVEKFGRLDILVHTAGIIRDRMVFNMTEQEFDAVIQVHLKGFFTVSRFASMVFRQQRNGRIIGFTSTSGLFGNVGQVNYGAAKDGIAGFIRGAALDLGKYGVTVNGIAPVAETRMTAIPESAMQARERAGISTTQAAREIPWPKRLPEDVAPAVVFLCTDAAKNINGQFLWVQAGMISLLSNPTMYRNMKKGGRWTFEEIALLFPQTIGKDLVNPAPPQPAQPK